ncbi:hypothetical protein Ae201684P_012160 [Aphanomyces euteiches]|nr:hypothetical protein Ae201684P_012160 [Aphanomyces euteiches]
MMHLQRNDVDDLLFNGLGTPELWHNLSEELQGVKILEHPRVQKKVLVKAIRMQTIAMRCMAGEFDQLRDRIEAVEKEAKHSQKQLEKANTKVLALEAALDTNSDNLKLIMRDDLKAMDKEVEAQRNELSIFAAKVENDVGGIKKQIEATKEGLVALEVKVDHAAEDQVITTDDVLLGQTPLTAWFDQYIEDNRRRDDIIKDASEKFTKQSRGIAEMMNEARKALDDNTSAVEEVQRALIDKADRVKVDLIIESKYEEIIEQLQKAMTAISDDEDEFKRNCRDLQDLVQNLSASKADKKDLLEVKEQVLYDSRVRQQVENLRAFIDLKMNREDVFAALKSKADKEEMQLLLKTLSDSLFAAVSKSSALAQEPDSAFLTKNSIHKRPGSLPSLEKERCLACNSVLSGSHSHPAPLGTTFGGGFQTAGYEKPLSKTKPAVQQPLPSLQFDSYLLGMDGHVYHGDHGEKSKPSNQADRERPRSSGGH